MTDNKLTEQDLPTGYVIDEARLADEKAWYWVTEKKLSNGEYERIANSDTEAQAVAAAIAHAAGNV